MRQKLKVLLALMLLGAVGVQAGKGKIRIAADRQGAYIYVDGKKKAMTGEGFTSILVEEGEHTIMVNKPNGSYHHFVRQKRIFVGAETSTKLTLKLINKPTEAYEQYKRNRWQRSGSVVTDTKLGLMWQDNRAAKTVEKKWKSAKRYCRNLSLAGYSDWRLPTYDELLTIVDNDRYDPAIMPAFEQVASGYYWSSSVGVSDSASAWYVYSKYGNTNGSKQSYEAPVRCVRTRQ
jgi:hypothetical protein